MAVIFGGAQVTVANGQTVSAVVDLDGRVLCGILTPAVLEATAMTFQTSHDGVNFVALVDESGTAVGVSGVAPSKDISLGNELTHFYGVKYLKVVLGTATGADRVLGLRTRVAA